MSDKTKTKAMNLLSIVGVIAITMILSSSVEAIPLWVDGDTGELVMEKPAVIGLWPDENGHCQETLDGQHIAHSDRYQVDDFMYQEHDFGEYGGLAQQFTLYNAREAALYMHEQGVWAAPHSCSAINHQFLTQIMQPMVNDHLRSQVKGVASSTVHSTISGVMSARMHGIVLNLLCKDPRNARLPAEIRDEYHVCEAGEVTRIAQARQSQIHAIRADRNRRYDSGTTL